MYISKNKCNVGTPHPPKGFVWKWPKNNEFLTCEHCDNRFCEDNVCFEADARCKQHRLQSLPVLKKVSNV